MSPCLCAAQALLRLGTADTIKGRTLVSALCSQGLRVDDPRLAPLMEGLEERGGAEAVLDFEAFKEVVGSCQDLVRRALSGRLVVPSFQRLAEAVAEIFKDIKVCGASERAAGGWAGGRAGLSASTAPHQADLTHPAHACGATQCLPTAQRSRRRERVM